jgi:hypothetical protein
MTPENIAAQFDHETRIEEYFGDRVRAALKLALDLTEDDIGIYFWHSEESLKDPRIEILLTLQSPTGPNGTILQPNDGTPDRPLAYSGEVSLTHVFSGQPIPKMRGTLRLAMSSFLTTDPTNGWSIDTLTETGTSFGFSADQRQNIFTITFSFHYGAEMLN